MKIFQRKGKTHVFVLVIMILILVPLLTSTAWTIDKVTDLNTAEALASFDFSSGAGRIDRLLFDFYPKKLITPDDFKKNTYKSSDPASKDRKTVSCATCRIALHLKKGEVYGINADSATYAQKLWVDGKLLSSVGSVSETAKGFVPKTLNYAVYFTAVSDETEIVIERSNFVHAYGDFFELIIGPSQLITSMVNARLARIELILGAMLTASILFLVAGLSFRSGKRLVSFAVVCAMIAVRSSFVNPKPVMVFLPDLNWYVGHKIECCSLYVAIFFLFSSTTLFSAAPYIRPCA